MKIGIIGFGRLGKLITRYLAQDFDVLVYDLVDHTDEIKKLRATASTLKEVCECDAIIPFVPISAFESCIKEISPLLKDGALVIDVCSVKEIPVEIMQKNLPQSVQILATHPMFGPDSAKDTVFGSKIVISKIRINDDLYDKISSYLKTNGLKVVEVTPEEHDRQIAKSLNLAHLIGRVLIDFESTPQEIDTKGYRRLLKILETVENDSWQLFQDMNKYNRFAKETTEGFKDCLNKVLQRLED
ncbi:prephenate dehydrogenase/arogenate dehydrogenase family protein [Bacteriovorax sp. Seq25_V]|uniref:prephenate dehydrogenase/arogenate dehydrogenase family protein n=1 Tax=Bacteriovorax sp. Seq25_V TaxID=1201288 RepID=UPI000389E095|nr:prephenate dehydrogenase/arogenate dehydrogenase family protein [Bacteriovorax sp. Seq25_V]EQC45467.1 prephenate dehydrogenase [Bacteriovorax sp. Seq25_V]